MKIELTRSYIPKILGSLRLYHLIIWFIVSFLLMFVSYDHNTSIFPQWMAYLVFTGSATPVCWYIAYKLIPRYLYQKKIGRFILYFFLLAILNSLVTYLLATFIYHLLTGYPVYRSAINFFGVLFAVLVVELILIIATCIIKIIKDRYYMEQQLLQIEKEKVSTELSFLRSQVNPHFLFNVMNTIYFQIDKANTDARLSVEKFSEMLRYQLYECTTDRIQIKKELHYIENYVAIQTLRMEKESDIKLTIDGQMDNFMIAPLLILPIIENSFKHVSNFKEADKNKIYISVKKNDQHMLVIEAINTYDQAIGEKHLLQSGGLGIQNLKRRLELLYPAKYELTTHAQSGMYQTILKLSYND